MKLSKLICTTLAIFLCFFVLGCQNKKDTSYSIAVFVPGVISGSPVYEMLASGVTKAVDEFNKNISSVEKMTSLDIIEAGTNQAEWGTKLTAICASEKYDLIISSNSSLPSLIEPLTEDFTKQKFLLLDAVLEGNKSVATVNYNQREQAFLSGYAAGLITTASKDVLPYANSEKKIALIAAQEYPVMNNVILPGFIEGAHAVDPAITVDFKIVGNWYDASKSADIARSLYNSGVDVIMPIAGGANQGVLAEAKTLNYYVAWFDNNGYDKAPGFVLSSTCIHQEKMAYELTKLYLNGELFFGESKTVGAQDGYIDFISDDPICKEHLPQEILEKIEEKANAIKTGNLKLPLNE